MAKKKSVSSWKSKKVYSVVSPENFEEKEIGTSVADDPKKLVGRTVETSLANLTDDRRKQHLKLIFEIVRVDKDVAYTRFKKFYTPVGYLRYKIRKGNTKIEVISDREYSREKLRVKVMVLTRYRVSESVRKEISQVMEDILENHSDNTPEEILQLTLFGKLGTEMYKKARGIAPINRVEVHQIVRL